MSKNDLVPNSVSNQIRLSVLPPIQNRCTHLEVFLNYFTLQSIFNLRLKGLMHEKNALGALFYITSKKFRDLGWMLVCFWNIWFNNCFQTLIVDITQITHHFKHSVRLQISLTFALSFILAKILRTCSLFMFIPVFRLNKVVTRSQTLQYASFQNKKGRIKKGHGS